MMYLGMIFVYIIFVIVIWSALKVASDADDQMEEMYRQKQLEDKSNK